MPARSIVTAAVATVLVVVAAACDTGDGKTLRPPTSAEREALPTTTTSTTAAGSVLAGDAATFPTTPATSGIATAPFTVIVPWAEGAAIDATFTCDGGDMSPLISWTAPPAGTVEMALLMVDESADYIHWAVAGIPPIAGQKPQGTPFADGAIEGTNSFGNVGYQGPCPPAGAAHTYRITLYALSQQAELPDAFTGQDLESVAGPAALAVADVSGTYARAG